MRRHYQGIPENSSRNTHATAAALLLHDAGLQTILDIPCGAGAFAKRLSDAGKGVVASDILDLPSAENTPFVRCDMNEVLPFEAGRFDAVACLDGIAHTENPFHVVREFARIIRSGGVLVLSTPNLSSLRSRWRYLLTGFHNKGKTPLNEADPNPEHIVNAFSFAQIRYLLHANGFAIESIATNRKKAAALLYAPLVPLMYALTSLVFNREEKDQGQRLRNSEILRQMFSAQVLFGETLIIKARRGDPRKGERF